MRKFTPTQMLDLVHQALRSPEYRERLNVIHKHYPNVKSEGRCRDALLEIFNNEQEKANTGLRAYAEAKRHDLVITQEGVAEEGWLRIEMKYHFTYDFAHRVHSALAMQGATSTSAAKGKGDLYAITSDCLHSKNAGGRCDAFILIVQDRYGAAHLHASSPGSSRRKRNAYPVVHERGVPLHFLNEQMKLEHLYPETYQSAWRAPLEQMLRTIHQKRHYALKQPIEHEVARALAIPLTSHIFVLDFSVPELALPSI